MKISTRGRYAVRVLVDLAEQKTTQYVPLKSIAERQDLSLKYLGQILPILAEANLIKGMQGKGGGYRLNCDPARCSVGEVLRLTEGDLAPVACLGCTASICDRIENCRTLPMWKKFYEMTNDYFDHITIADLVLQDNSRI